MFGEYIQASDLNLSEYKCTKNDIFELQASTNTQFSKQERASIKRFDVRHNTKVYTAFYFEKYIFIQKFQDLCNILKA